MQENPYKEKLKYQFGESATKCPSCQGDLSPSDINLNETLAKCPHCSSVFSLEDDPFFFGHREGRPEKVMPDGTEVLKLGNTLEIRTYWKKSKSKAAFGFMGFFALMWNAMLLPGAIHLVSVGGILALLPMSLHLIAGIAMLAMVLSFFVNYTDIIIDEQFVTIDTQPIRNPLSKSIKYSIENVNQVYVKKYQSGKSKNGRPIYELGLFMQLNDRRKIKLLGGLTKDTLLYMEQELERFLKIPDQMVPGEILDSIHKS